MERLLKTIVKHFAVKGTVSSVKPLGNGLINDTYIVRTEEPDASDYVLQRINHQIFTDVDVLMDNIAAVTGHIRAKLEKAGEDDIDRKVLTFIPNTADGKYYFFDGEYYWRMMVFIPDAETFEAVNPDSSRNAGKAFGHFQAMLVDIDKELKESIPDFHNMEFRLKQLHDAVEADPEGRVAEVKPLLDELEKRGIPYDVCPGVSGPTRCAAPSSSTAKASSRSAYATATRRSTT